jgi:hypothetical protein
LTLNTLPAAKGEPAGNGDVLAIVKMQDPKVVTPVAVKPPLVIENPGVAPELVNATVVGPVTATATGGVLPSVPEKPFENDAWIGAAPAAGTRADTTALDAATVTLEVATTVGELPPPPPQAPNAPSTAKDSTHLVDVA